MLVNIENEKLYVNVNTLGAELQSIIDGASGVEVLWQADPQYWARHAPVLFPIVGKLKHNKLKENNHTYPISQHGFARDSEFTLVSRTKTSVILELKSTEETHRHFPYDFVLQVKYSLDGNCLKCDFTVINPSKKTLPFSLGGHPAFNWPLLPGIPKEQHKICFDSEESGVISLLDDGLICNDDLPSPVKDRELSLKEDLFNNDALIFKNINSKTLRFEAIQDKRVSACIEMKFEDFNDLGIWTKPGADFLCLEPWLGYSSAVNFEGDFKEKAGIIHLAPESHQCFSFSINIEIND